MKRRYFVFLFAFVIVFPCFVFYLFSVSGSDSGQLGTPAMEFKSWQVGRSDKGTDINDKEDKSFITSTQALCRWTASIGYQSGIDVNNTSPIDPDTVKWTVEDASHTMTLDKKSVKQNWSGSSPSEMASDTAFNVVASLTVPKVVGTRDVRYKDKNGVWRTKKVPDYLTATSCTADDANRSNRTPVHRGGTKMKFTIKFTAQTEDGQNVAYTLALEADDIDQIRQEYVDYNRLIPDRGDSTWSAEDTYDFGDYKKMMNAGLDGYMKKWVGEINKLRGTDKETKEKIPEFKVSDFYVSSGYRNPHHNFDHAGSTSLLSSHMYGYALDVRGKALAGNRLLDIDGDRENTNADREEMTEAAKPNASARFTWIYSTKHVHADWAPSNWANRSSAAEDPPEFKLPPSGGTSETSTTLNLVPSDGVYTATAGTGHEANLTLNEVPSYVFWYVQSPGESAPGTLAYQDTSGSLTSQLNYSFPSGVSGNYVISVSGTSASMGSVITASYTVSVSASTPTVPGAPTITRVDSGDSQVNINWIAPSNNGGSDITDYEYQYRESNGGTWETWTSFGDRFTSTSEDIAGLTNGTAYEFRCALSIAWGECYTAKRLPTVGINAKISDDVLLKDESLTMAN